jgi:hypothetical protein
MMPSTESEKHVSKWLKEAGLLHHSSNLGRLSVPEFRNLQMQVRSCPVLLGRIDFSLSLLSLSIPISISLFLICLCKQTIFHRKHNACSFQDYSKHGVVKSDDKQKLFRVIKAVNQEWRTVLSEDKRCPDPPPVSFDDSVELVNEEPAIEVCVLLVPGVGWPEVVRCRCADLHCQKGA